MILLHESHGNGLFTVIDLLDKETHRMIYYFYVEISKEVRCFLLKNINLYFILS